MKQQGTNNSMPPGASNVQTSTSVQASSVPPFASTSSLGSFVPNTGSTPVTGGSGLAKLMMNGGVLPTQLKPSSSSGSLNSSSATNKSSSIGGYQNLGFPNNTASLLSFNNVRGQTGSQSINPSQFSNASMDQFKTASSSFSHHDLPINEFSSPTNDMDLIQLRQQSSVPTMSSSSANNGQQSTEKTKNNSQNIQTLQKEMSNIMKRPRRVAKLACVSCRKAHACCEDKRPCTRCLTHGLECQDQVGKKRGRKKKGPGSEGEENDGQNEDKTEAKKKKRKNKNSPKNKSTKEDVDSEEQGDTDEQQDPLAMSQNQQNLADLTTPGALLHYNRNNVIFPNGDTHGLSLPLLLNQPPEIQQLTQVLMRTPVDTFYLHCNNLNSAYDYQTNQSLFGTPYSLHVNDNSLSVSPNNYKSNGNSSQLVSPGASSPFIDFNSDDFLRFSPQSPMFASLVEMDEHEIETEGANLLPVTPQEQETKVENNATSDDVHIEEYNRDDTADQSSYLNQPQPSDGDEEIFEKLKRMSNEELIKSLHIGDDTKKMIEESISHLKDLDSNPEAANMTYIEYLTQNFPISLLLKHKLSESARRIMNREKPSSNETSKERELELLREENMKLKEENLRKANESAMLSAINENLRNRFSEMVSKGLIKVHDDEHPNYGRDDKPTAIQNSYQELVMLMENKQEMDSSNFGIMIMFPGGRLVSINRTLLTKLNYDPSDLYDNLERWEDVVHPESYPQIIAHISRVLKLPPAPRKSFKCKVNCRKKSGGVVPAELYLCIVGGKLSYIPVFAIGYFLFEENTSSASSSKE